MMAENNNNNKQPLRELLKEDQEPFFLKDYIADRRSQLITKRSVSVSKTHLQMKKIRKPTNITKTTMISPSPPPSKQQNFAGKFCRNACFFSTNTSFCSPDVRKSPRLEFPSPSVTKSPCKNSPILLHIPAGTSALLLEAALRIQKQSNSNNKSKTQIKTSQGFGIFGSFLKKLAHGSGNRKREILGNIAKEKALQNLDGDKCTSTVSSSSSSSSSASSSSSSSKCLDLETSSSSSTSTSHSEEMEFVRKVMMLKGVHDFCDDDDEEDNITDEFCDQSPFHFVLQRSPSSGHRTPEFSSPANSPCRLKQEEKENYIPESTKEFQIEEEEKEQFSPVSVLDPLFEDDYDGCHDEDEDAFDLDSSYAIVQRTKNQLLQKLRRFEKLAELDPIELEKRMLEDDDNDANDSYHFGDLEEEEEECDDFESNALQREANTLDGFIRGVLSKSSLYRTHHAPEHMKRLISDLIVEESRVQNHTEEIREEEIVRRICKRFESWKEVQSNTIDMMVEQDFRKELQGWKDNKEQIGETAMEIELAIFGLLVEELGEELVC